LPCPPIDESSGAGPSAEADEMDELPVIHRAIVIAIGRRSRDDVDPVALACDLGLPVEAVHEVLGDLADLSPRDRERLLGEPAPRNAAT